MHARRDFGLARHYPSFTTLVCLVLVLVAFSPPAAAQTWEIEVVANGKAFRGMSDRSLCLDAEGHPRIAYGDDNLYYASFDGTTWHLEVADPSMGVGAFASMALDGAGNPHISYFSQYRYGQDSDLYYAYRDGAGWHREFVDAEGEVGRRTSLALDGQGRPHICYYDDTNNALKYAYRGDTGWQAEVVDSIGEVAWWSDMRIVSLVVDAAGHAHAGYYRPSGGDLMYATRDDTGWHMEAADTTGVVGAFPSLALDASGLPRIGYQDLTDEGNTQVMYAEYDGAAWHVCQVDTGGALESHVSLALDSSGNPHISNDAYWSVVKYSWRDESGWHTEIAAEGEFVGWFTSLALDASGRAHISHVKHFAEDATAYDLLYTLRGETGWQTQEVDHEGLFGADPCLALDSAGTPHFAYMEGRTLSLGYATMGAAGWYTEIVHPGGQIGLFSSIAMDSSDNPHISYHEFVPGGGLDYARKDAAGWHIEVVDASGWVGPHSSLALDQRERPHISYQDRGWYNLKYAFKGDGGWHVQTVDAAGDVGTYTSIAVDASGCPHISYYDGTNDALKYASWEDAGWEIVTVDASAAVGSYTSLALDADGRAHISYYDGTNSALKYAYWDENGLHVETVDSEGEVGIETSLALDDEGNPHISYLDHGAMHYGLKYAYRGASGWVVQNLASDAADGTSIDLDAPGTPHIAYHSLYRDLKYAHLGGPGSISLSAQVAGSVLQLSWQPVNQVSAYWVYGASNLPWFVPGFAPDYQYRITTLPCSATTWSSSNGVGDPAANWTYLVMAVDAAEQELCRSNRVGEEDFEAEIPQE
jgi:hypothetical protein